LTVALWLYAASANFAEANTTYDLAYRHGIVWRSYYANRTPPQAIPNVGAMAPGDTLYLGYRAKGRIALIGRMRLGRPDPPDGISPVFTAVPAVLVSDFAKHGYSNDPVMGRMMGLFAEEVEPVAGTIPSQGRLTITELSRDPLEGDAPLVTLGGLRSELSPSVEAHRTSLASPSTNSEKLVAVLKEVSFIGVDVAGRSSKGYDLCNLVWSKSAPVRADFKRLPHSTPLPPTSSLRLSVAAGDFQQLAALTHAAAASTGEELWKALVQIAGSTPSGVFIDSPSAFSRNAAGHGRLTEKQSISGVCFQSTPSISCGREHGADWGWLLYGMVAFAACLHQGRFTLEQWAEALSKGLFAPTQNRRFVVREVFPTATVSHLRSRRRGHQVQSLIRDLRGADAERQVVEAYLESGVQAVKQPGQSLFDRADALVAALSSLPHARQDFDESLGWPQAESVRWRSEAADAHLVEGAIALPG
jgi:hypothetical protein